MFSNSIAKAFRNFIPVRNFLNNSNYYINRFITTGTVPIHKPSVFVDNNTRVICQGFTGKSATFHCEHMLAYGTKLVGGISPKHAGSSHLNLPVFATVADAVKETNANTSVIFVPPTFAANAIIEAIDSKLDLVVVVTEGIPVHDMAKIKNRLVRSGKTKVIGPNCPGITKPSDNVHIGIIPGFITMPGRVGIVSRSGTLTYEAVYQTTKSGLGQSVIIGIGGDPINGTNFVDVLQKFFDDTETDGIIMIGEIGGTAEEEACDFISKYNVGINRKPIVGFIAGLTAPPGKRMGHAGAIISGNKGKASDKIMAMKEAGVIVSPSPATIGSMLLAEMKASLKA